MRWPSLFSLYDVLPIRDLSLDIIDIGARYTEAERYATLRRPGSGEPDVVSDP